MSKHETASISVEEFDARFDAGEDMSEYVDWTKAVWQPGIADDQPLVLPARALDRVEAEARRLGISPAELITRWILERVDNVTG